MPNESAARYIVVGVTSEQPPAVLHHAVRLARRFNAVLVCANVDRASEVVTEHPDGSVEARTIDPEAPARTPSPFDGELANRIRSIAQEGAVQVEFRELAGNVAYALGRLGEVLEAELIVVGSRHRGVLSSIQDFFGGSMAVRLARRQHRLVVVVPLDPVPAGD